MKGEIVIGFVAAAAIIGIAIIISTRATASSVGQPTRQPIPQYHKPQITAASQITAQGYKNREDIEFQDFDPDTFMPRKIIIYRKVTPLE